MVSVSPLCHEQEVYTAFHPESVDEPTIKTLDGQDNVGRQLHFNDDDIVAAPAINNNQFSPISLNKGTKIH